MDKEPSPECPFCATNGHNKANISFSFIQNNILEPELFIIVYCGSKNIVMHQDRYGRLKDNKWKS
jgi:hypothetical protein